MTAWPGFSLPQGKENPAHGLLALNHEYIDNGMLFKGRYRQLGS